MHSTQTHKDDYNEQDTSSIKVRQLIRERTKPSIEETSEDDSSICKDNHLLFFNVFLSHVIFEFQAFHIFFHINKKF